MDSHDLNGEAKEYYYKYRNKQNNKDVVALKYFNSSNGV